MLVPALLFGALNVLGPLRLDVLGLSALAIGATWLVAASFEAALSPLIGRFSDRRGRLAPLRVGLIGSAVGDAQRFRGSTEAGRSPRRSCSRRARSEASGRPSMSMLADRAEAIGLDYAYGFALINLAWAPGAAAGSALGGAAARATSDAAVYLTLSALCVFTLVVLAPRLREPAPATR